MSARRLGRPLEADGEQTRRRILEAALRQFSTNGYAKTTLRSIAEEVGITSGAVYHYFASKPALVTLLLVEWADVTVERNQHVLEEGEPLSERLIALVEDSVGLYEERPELAAFAARAVSDLVRYPELADANRSSARTMQRFYTKVVDDGIDAGDVRPDIDRQGLIDLVAVLSFCMATIAAASLGRHRKAVDALAMLVRGDLVIAGGKRRPRARAAP